ncbi:MAG: protein kinase [Vicinamibacterales bacterium]
MSDARQLSEVAAAVADGVEVDWCGAASGVYTSDDRARLTDLRLIESIAEAYRRADASAAPNISNVAPVLAEEPLPVGTRWGSLEILESIGRGTCGHVYRARDTRLDREVALKLRHQPDRAPHRETEREAVHEGRLLARVRHPNVVAVYGADRIEGQVGIWMELIDGGSLADEARARGALSPGAVRAIGLDLCRALAAVHEAGLIHRDVKAQNVMRDCRDGRIVLMDFSAGREIQGAVPSMIPGSLVGSPLYLAPEVLAGRPASVQSDIYSLGVLLFRLVSETFPVSGRSLLEIAEAHAAGRVTHLTSIRPDLPAALVQSIERAILPAPRNRFASASQFARALAVVPPPPTRLAGRSRPWIFAAVLALAMSATSSFLAWRVGHPGAAAVPFQARDWVLIGAFDNRTGDAAFDNVLEQALERELSASGFVNVVPRPRVEDVLGLMKISPETRLEPGLAREVSLRDGAIRILLTGGITRVGDEYVLTTNLVRPSDGATVTAISDDLTGPNELLPRMRSQALRVRAALGEALVSVERSEAELQKVTTPSLSALQLYSQAATLLSGEFWLFRSDALARYEVAEQLLRQATATDSSFASAWLLMAHAVASQGRTAAEYLPLAERAVALTDHVTRAERYFILGFTHRRRATAAWGRTGELDAAARAYETLLQLQPDHYWALLELEQVYRQLDRIDDAERVALRAAAGRPHSMRFAVNAARVHLRHRNSALLGAVAARVLGSLPPGSVDAPGEAANDLNWLRLWEAHDAWVGRDVTRALAAARRAEQRWSESGGTFFRYHLSQLYQGLGSFGDARRVIGSMPHDDRDFSVALVAARQEDWPELRRLVQPDHRRFEVLNKRAAMLVWAGWLEAAEWVSTQRSTRATPIPPDIQADFEGQLRVAQGGYAEGLEMLEPLTKEAARPRLRVYEAVAFARARVGDRAAAIGLLEHLDGTRAVAVTYAWTVYDWLRCRVLLADLYRQTDRVADAERVEAEVRSLLAVADSDHPLLVRLATRR